MPGSNLPPRLVRPTVSDYAPGTLALGGDHKPVIEADELERRGPPFGREEGRSELKGVGRAERMNPKEAPRGFEDGFHRLDPMPMPGEGVQAFQSFGCRLRGKAALSFRREMAEAHSTSVPHQAITPITRDRDPGAEP